MPLCVIYLYASADGSFKVAAFLSNICYRILYLTVDGSTVIANLSHIQLDYHWLLAAQNN